MVTGTGTGLAITQYLLKNNPKLLERRMRGGPWAEKEKSQQIIMSFAFIPIKLVVVWRLLEEEKFLLKNLPGYAEYRNKVRYRLVPYLW